MNKGQQIARIQELAEDKIAVQADEDKQAYASRQAQEDLSGQLNQDQNQP